MRVRVGSVLSASSSRVSSEEREEALEEQSNVSHECAPISVYWEYQHGSSVSIEAGWGEME